MLLLSLLRLSIASHCHKSGHAVLKSIRNKGPLSLALKLLAPKRWLACKKALQEKHGIVVHFPDHDGYYSAYKYICKFDGDVFHSDNHPNINEIGSPKTQYRNEQ